MSDQKKSSQKTSPFNSGNTPKKAVREPATRPRSNKRMLLMGNGRLSQRGMLSVLSLLISLLSLALSMLGGAWVAIGILIQGLDNQVGMFPRVLALGLAYGIGWIVSLYGIRMLGNLILPLFIRAYAWITLAGICILHVAIIAKLFNQTYNFSKFNLYILMMGAGLLALIGLHLIIEKHNLVPFSFPILAISLIHLVLIVFHYVFIPLEPEKYAYIWGDVGFLVFTGFVGGLMLAHLGLLNGFRNRIDRIFDGPTSHFVPPD